MEEEQDVILTLDLNIMDEMQFIIMVLIQMVVLEVDVLVVQV